MIQGRSGIMKSFKIKRKEFDRILDELEKGESEFIEEYQKHGLPEGLGALRFAWSDDIAKEVKVLMKEQWPEKAEELDTQVKVAVLLDSMVR